MRTNPVAAAIGVALVLLGGTGAHGATRTAPVPKLTFSGDYDGDGYKDIATFTPATGTWTVFRSNGSSAFANSTWATWSAAVTWVDVRVGDFNGDGKSDIAGRVSSTGQWYVGLSTGTSFATTLWDTWSPSVSWVDVQVGDLNGDGKADLVGRNSATGQVWGAVSSGSAFSTTLWDAWSTAVTWSPVLLGDFNGDGRADAAHYGSNDQWWVGVSGGSSFTSTKWWPSQA